MQKLTYILASVVMILACTPVGPAPELDPFPQPEPKPEPQPEPVPQIFQDDSLGVFCKDFLSEMTVQVQLSDWNSLLLEYDRNNKTEMQIPVDVTYTFKEGSGVVGKAGFRIKGNTSRRRPERGSGEHRPGNMQHAHFQLKNDEFVEDNPKFLGEYKKIALKYAHEDPTYIREIYGYDLYRRFGVWTGAKGSYTKLYLNIPEGSEQYYLGVYMMFEPIDKQYIKRRSEHFGDAKGNLWKCNWGSGLNERDPRHVDELMRLEDPTGANRYAYELKTNEDKLSAAQTQLKDFIYNLNNKQGEEFRLWIESITDIELLLRTLAVTTSIGHWDGYWGNTNNHYIYFNSKGKFFIIPYDLDNILGTASGDFFDPGRQDMCYWAPSNVDASRQRPLYYKVLQIPQYRERYIELLHELHAPANELFDYSASAKRIEAWQNLVRGSLKNSTGEDEEIKDRPASWGNHPEYRVYTMCNDNFFKVRSANLPTK